MSQDTINDQYMTGEASSKYLFFKHKKSCDASAHAYKCNKSGRLWTRHSHYLVDVTPQNLNVIIGMWGRWTSGIWMFMSGVVAGVELLKPLQVQSAVGKKTGESSVP